jgi:hypothetical protein
MRGAGFVLLVAATGCIGDLDPVWQLDHDRIIAVRATPPSILAGSSSVIDAFLAHKGSSVDEESPIEGIVLPTMPMELQGALVQQGSQWVVVAPDEAVLDQARTDLGLASGAPVGLEIGLLFAGSGSGLAAEKFVFLGSAADNPVVEDTLVGGVDPGSGMIVIPGYGIDTTLTTEAGSAEAVNWLTSCGTMHDANEISTFMNVEQDDPTTGELAVVRRDGSGGVAWAHWPIMSSGPGSGSL